MKWQEVKTAEDLETYLDQPCFVTCAHKIGTCGETCCTPSGEEIAKILTPKPLPLKKSFMLFLADFKAKFNK